MHEFYNRIRRVFEEAGSNRHQFCRKYHFHYQTLQAYWDTDKLPSGEVLAKLAQEYHVSIDALVLGNATQDGPADHPIVARITQFLRQQDEESLVRIDGALQMFRMLQLTSDRASALASSGSAAADLIPENAQKASNVLADLARFIRASSMDEQEKKAAGQMVGQVVRNIFQREGKDEWAQLEEVT